MPSGKAVRTLTGHVSEVKVAVFLPDGKRLAVDASVPGAKPSRSGFTLTKASTGKCELGYSLAA